MRFLVVLLTIALLADIIGMVSSLWIKLPYLNSTASNIYLVISIISINLFYQALFPSRFKFFFIASIAVLLLFYSYYLFTTQHLGVHIRNVPSNVVFIILPLLFFYKLINEMPTTHIQRLPVFWINAGLLMYFAGTLILWVVSDYLVQVLKDSRNTYWIFHNFLVIVKNALIGLGLWQVTRRPKLL
jgi:hypothetical protein